MSLLLLFDEVAAPVVVNGGAVAVTVDCPVTYCNASAVGTAVRRSVYGTRRWLMEEWF